MVKPYFAHRLLRARDFQDRSEMLAVRTWWRNLGGAGICSLEGIGGAGKTSLVDRFLRILPGVMPSEPGIRKDSSLGVPDAVFVHSFYDAPHADDLFWNLATWLLGGPHGVASRSGRPPYDDVNARLAAEGSVLIVLDGLERVQDDGSRGRRFGSITDPRLRDFLFRVADGQVPNVGVLVTTRFRLEDLTTYDPRRHGSNAQGVAPLPFYHRVTVDRLSAAACAVLLERLGVKGTEDELRRIAESCGFHALTVDLFGGYIVHFLKADARIALSSLHSITLEGGEEPRGGALADYVQQQTRRFSRVAERYREALAKSDPVALSLLQRTCVFRLGATAELLTLVMNAIISASTETDSEQSHLSACDIRAKLDLLVSMHLLEGSGKSPGGETIYTTHPAVRDGFLATLDHDIARQTHEAARVSMSNLSLTVRPGDRSPNDKRILDEVEEIFYHTLKAGHTADAHRIYEDRLGGFSNLCWALGDYERGERICRGLVQDGLVTDRLRDEWALYLVALGRIHEALDCLDVTTARRDVETLAGVLLLTGRLRDVLNVSEGRILDTPERVRHSLAYIDELISRGNQDRVTSLRNLPSSQSGKLSGTKAFARALMGDVDGGLLEFSRLLPNIRWEPSAALAQGSPLWHLPTLLQCTLFVRVGLDEEAKRGAQFIRSEIASILRNQGSMYDTAARLLLAEVAMMQGDFTEVDNQVRIALEWAVERDAREMLCWAWLIRARLANRFALEGSASDAGHASIALDATNNGLRIARQSGFSIYHADLALERAQSLLCLGDAEGADHFIRMSLYGLSRASALQHPYDARANDESAPQEELGIFPPQDSGLPSMLAIDHLYCGYVWGRSLALHLSAEVWLLRAARVLNSTRIDPQSLVKLSGVVGEAVHKARSLIAEALCLRDQSRDARYAETMALEQDLDVGIFTRYPLMLKQLDLGKKRDQVPQRRVFISYAHRDNEGTDPQQRWLDRLLEHLAPFVHQRDLALWSDHDIGVGDAWHEQIQHSLRHASAAVLMVSPAYLASEYIRNNELPVLLKNASSDGLRILPVILRPCAFAETRFRFPDPVNGPEEFTLGSLQAAGDPTRPLSKMGQAEQDEVLLSVAKRLLELSKTDGSELTAVSKAGLGLAPSR